jgi:hypothetical protein
MLTLLLSCGTAGVAAAATTPAPQISPPPQCFVVKDGALPLCTANPNGTWTVTYPTGGGNLNDGTGAPSNTKRDVGLAILVVCVIGIVAIVLWQWVLPRRRNRPSISAPPTVPGVPVTEATATAYYPENHGAAATPVSRPAVLPPEAFAAPAPPPAPPLASDPPAASAAQPQLPPQMVTQAQADQLTVLNNMLSQGQITRDVYDARREAILGGT